MALTRSMAWNRFQGPIACGLAYCYLQIILFTKCYIADKIGETRERREAIQYPGKSFLCDHIFVQNSYST